MARNIAFPVSPGTIEGLDFVLAERRKADPATPSRDTYLATLVEEAVAAELDRLSAARPLLRPQMRTAQ